jgi:SNF2 family DNA or RNA helicase
MGLHISHTLTQKHIYTYIHTYIHTDDMGLGKTIQCITLIVANPAKSGPKPTLVVSPLTVIENWRSQIVDHAPGARLNVIIWHGTFVGSLNLDSIITTHIHTHTYIHIGTGRHKKFNMSHLKYADVVITSYGTLANELEDKTKKDEHEVVRFLKKKKQWLLMTDWHRIILDEAHIIRNKRTKAHKACKMIKAKHRWALTGTPIPNSQNDAFGLASFLRIEPVNDGGVFHKYIGEPIKKGTAIQRQHAMTRLRLLFKSISIRRTKKILGNNLPSKNIIVRKIVLDSKTREIYDLILSASQYAVSATMQADQVQRNFLSILVLVCRLKQACLDLSLLPDDIVEVMKNIEDRVRNREKGKPFTAAELQSLFNCLNGIAKQATEEAYECVICYEPQDPKEIRVLRNCKHSFCKTCLEHHIKVERDRGRHKAMYAFFSFVCLFLSQLLTKSLTKSLTQVIH